jgi:hypothetical protein
MKKTMKTKPAAKPRIVEHAPAAPAPVTPVVAVTTTTIPSRPSARHRHRNRR